MKALEEREGVAPLCLRFSILTALRSGSVRGARWSELSFEGAPTWTVPGERMKAPKSRDVAPHRVPLSTAAVATLLQAYRMVISPAASLSDLPRLAAKQKSALIFPSKTGKGPFSDMALSEVSMAETNCARWRRKSVPVWLREKGYESPGLVFSAARIEARGA